jgi:hypothetical protein
VNAKNDWNQSALHLAAGKSDLALVQLLVQNGAELNCPDNNGHTPILRSAAYSSLSVAQYLLEHKADVHYRISKGYHKHEDALYCTMLVFRGDRCPSTTFAFLSSNADTKNLKIEGDITDDVLDDHKETYKCIQSSIDGYHYILNLVLSEHVQVDMRVGSGHNGLYQEPLERCLEYLGLSMSNDQVVNTSIDGEGEEGVKRALIPGHLLNAKHWFDMFREESLIFSFL